jgi:hypothetical protein
MPRKTVWVTLLLAQFLWADSGQDLLAAARKGQTAQVAALIAKGAKIETTDKNGRTALMLAAQKGHADTVKLLLEKSAKATARDREGWTAFGLAVMSGGEGREAVMDQLPRPKPLSVFVESTWTQENLYSSCFITPAQLAEHVSSLRLDALETSAIPEYGAAHGKGLVEFVEAEPADAVLHVTVRPGVSCLPRQTADQINLAIDVHMVRSRNQATMMEKTFGGGLKGLHTRMATSPSQYESMLGEWARSHTGAIYEAMLEAWLRGDF